MELILFCSAVEAIILGIKSIKKKNNSKKKTSQKEGLIFI